MVDTKKLEEVASRLNKASDEINVILQKVQSALNASNIGLEIWLDESLTSDYQELPVDDNGDINYSLVPFRYAVRKMAGVFLGYARTSNGWGLAVKTIECYYDGQDFFVGGIDLTRPELLLNASRAIRVAALPQLQALIDALTAKAEDSIVVIEKARQLANEL